MVVLCVKGTHPKKPGRISAEDLELRNVNRMEDAIGIRIFQIVAVNRTDNLRLVREVLGRVRTQYPGQHDVLLDNGTWDSWPNVLCNFS